MCVWGGGGTTKEKTAITYYSECQRQQSGRHKTLDECPSGPTMVDLAVTSIKQQASKHTTSH